MTTRTSQRVHPVGGRYKRPPYPGGKSSRSTHSVTGWLTNLMPPTTRYAEVYAGMLGVLLARPPVEVEVANDLDGRITNWWNVVRDRPEELRQRFRMSPRWSRPLWEAARTADQTSGVEGAFWFSLVCQWSYSGIANGLVGMRQVWDMPARPDRIVNSDPLTYDLGGLSARMRRVAIENLPDTRFLEKTAKLPDILIYCDPPYPTAEGSQLYRHCHVNVGEVSDRLTAQKGKVLISGYQDEWDHLLDLGWHRTERPAKSMVNTQGNTGRVEVAWTNYPPRRTETQDSLWEHPD